eukprot:COSAG01_NODE_43_length_32320_cov_622.744763_32_plen_46_part_00
MRNQNAEWMFFSIGKTRVDSNHAARGTVYAASRWTWNTTNVLRPI